MPLRHGRARPGLPRWLDSSIAAWRDDPLRKTSNEVGGALDGRIWLITLAGGLLYLAFKHVLEERLYGFACLVLCLHIMPIAVLEFWFRRRHHAAYLRHRELVVSLGIASTLFWAPVMVLQLHNHFDAHHGSALFLAVFIFNTGPLWLGMFGAHACLPLRWGCFAAPLLALMTLRHYSALCAHVVETPGVDELLATLCDGLSLVHSVAAPMGGPDCSRLTPMQQCRTFYLWSVTWSGVAMPLLATCYFEARLLRRTAQEPAAHPQQHVRSDSTLQITLRAYLLSTAAWFATCFVEALLRPALNWA